MIVELLKDHIFFTKVVSKGEKVELSNGNGEELIAKGIARDVTIQHKRQQSKKAEEQAAEQEELANKADEERVEMLADKVADKIETKKNKKNKNK